MLRVKTAIVAALVWLVMTGPGLAQNQPEPQELLKKVSETYKNLKRYHFESLTITETKSEGIEVKSKSRSEELNLIAAIKPDRLRIEAKNPAFSLMAVTNGQTHWVTLPALKQYTRKAAGAAADAPKAPTAAGGPDFISMWIGRAATRLAGYERLADQAREAKSLPDEAVEVGGQRRECYVVEVKYSLPGAASSSKTLWIDKTRFIILREISMSRSKTPMGSLSENKQTTTFTTANVDEPLSDALFAFVPPEGAKEVEELNIPGYTRPKRVEFTGKEALDFTLKDLDGKPFNLQSLRGKVVLLDFWATWCGPCRAELPHIEKLHREFKDRDLVVLGIDDEEPEIAREFLKKQGYTFTSLVDDQRTVAHTYQVNGIPQVFVIGKDGKVVAHLFGARSESELRAALQKAGITAGRIAQATAPQQVTQFNAPRSVDVGSAQASRTSMIRDRFVGTWKNIDPQTRGITTLRIQQSGAKTMVQAWGKCHPADCDWGQVEAYPYGPNISSNLTDTTQVLSAVFQHGFSQRLMLIFLEGKDRLRVEVLTRFTDSSGRSNFRSSDTFVRGFSTSASLSSASEGNDSTSGTKEKIIPVPGGVLQGNAIKKVPPPYPEEAKAAHASGAVQVQVTISEDGHVIEAAVISGHPLLREASLEAAKQWIFKPVELSGVPVKVQGILTFNFTLQ